MSDPFGSMEKKFSSFFWPFFDSESLKSKIKNFEKKKFFLKNLVKKQLLGPKFRPKRPDLAKNIFFVILKPHVFQRGVTCLCLKKFEKIRFFGPETGRRARIQKNRNFRDKSLSVSFLQFWSSNFVPKIMKILRAVFQKNRDLCHFQAVLGYFGPF